MLKQNLKGAAIEEASFRTCSTVITVLCYAIEMERIKDNVRSEDPLSVRY